MWRSAMAITLGLFGGVMVMLGFDFASNTLFPTPNNAAAFSAEQLAAYVQGLPLTAFLLVVLGWFFATVDAAIISAWLAPNRPLLHSAISSTILLLLAAISLLKTPYPFWMVVVTPFIYITAFFIGSRVGQVLHQRHHSTNSTASG